MSMRGAVAGCVVLVCLVALLAERTEGHITFFSPKEMMLMKEREGRKDMEPRSDDGLPDEDQQPPQVEHDRIPATVGTDPGHSPEHQDLAADEMREFFHELLHQKAK